MCGRYQVSMEEDIIEMREILGEINRRYFGTPLQDAVKTGEVFPTEYAPILIGGPRRPRAVLMRWGFPRPKGNGVVINARSETAGQKGMFGAPFERYRCVVPTTGFFEWRAEGGKTKEKYLFRLPGTKMLYLAGLFSTHAPPGKDPYPGYVVLTGEANASVAEYHDRMPLVLHWDQLVSWISDTGFARDFVHAPCGAELIAARA